MVFYHRFMTEIRQSILRGDFLSYYETKRFELMRSDEDNPAQPPKKTKAAQSARLGDYEIHTSDRGFFSIRQISSGEIMHSINPPIDEANKLYVEQSFLAGRLFKKTAETNEWVIWDVGLGAGANAMATIHCFEKCLVERGKEALRPLRLISFELDLDPLILAAKYPGRFPHLQHGAPLHILERGQWKHTSKLLEWELLKGDFADFIESAKIPDVIFYDPFSYKTDGSLWTHEIFSRILKRCLPRSAELYTYSASTAVRVALLAAGFFVAQGIGTGPKSETTIAFTRPTGAQDHPFSPRLLGHRWLSRWRRSDAKFPATVGGQEKAVFEKLIERHPQFSTIL